MILAESGRFQLVVPPRPLMLFGFKGSKRNVGGYLYTSRLKRSFTFDPYLFCSFWINQQYLADFQFESPVRPMLAITHTGIAEISVSNIWKYGDHVSSPPPSPSQPVVGCPQIKDKPLISLLYCQSVTTARRSSRDVGRCDSRSIYRRGVQRDISWLRWTHSGLGDRQPPTALSLSSGSAPVRPSELCP